MTKVGARRDGSGAWLPAFTPDQIEAAVHDNLQRLGVEAMDVVNLRVMFGQSPTEGSIAPQLQRLHALREQGLVGHVGVSSATASQVREARDLGPLVCVQNHYNLVHRTDDALIDELAEAGIAYVPFFPLGGFAPIQSEELAAIAGELDASPQQVALAWLLARSPNVLLIPGTSSVAHLRDNVAAAALTIPPAQQARLDGLDQRG